MAGLPPELLRAIDPQVRQVRRTLRELDPQELPASLHKVAATEGGRLPPPLLAKLLTELDGNEWLRERLVEKLGDRIEPATQAFLIRGSGWWLGVAEATMEATRSRPPEPAGDEVAALEMKLAVTRERLARAEAGRDQLRDELKQAKATRARLVDPDAVAAELDALRTENRRLEASFVTEEARRAEADQRAENLRRRTRAAAETQIPSHPRPRAVGMGDPMEVARRLDTDITALAVGVAPSNIAHPGEAAEALREPVAPLRLAPGISPDQPEAVGWLFRLADPVRVIVDGYNLTYMLDPGDFTSGTARRRLVSLLGRIASRKPHQFLVVFDSDQPPGRPSWVGDVEVRFSGGEKADDRIVELAAATGDVAVAVVTNDRELRERVEAVGALALWGDALMPHLG